MTKASGQRGFTLIELLITILIIGILAAIGLAAYNGQRDRAKDAKAQTAARSALTAAESYYVGHDTYIGLDDPDTGLSSEEATLTPVTTDAAMTATNRILVQSVTATRVRLCSKSETDIRFCVIIRRDINQTIRKAFDVEVVNTLAPSAFPDW